MAKIAPKGKKVTGTKKKDKITWQSTKPWKKALTVKGLAGNDVINFKKSSFKNKLYGGKGNDKIYGGKKVDTIHGEDGNDLLYGYNGNDILYGDAGNDKLYGGKGNDKLYGGAGSDILNGDAGNDIIYVGAGNDTVNAGAGTNTIYMKKKEGTNTILNGGGNDTLVFADEKNFNNFTFANVGNDLKVTAGGTTALIKNFVTGKSSVKNIKAGNLSFSNIVKGAADSYETYGTSGNDYFIFDDENSHKVYTGAGNDILSLNEDYSYYIYAAQGNDYIDASKAYRTTLYLSGISGNDTITPNWDGYTYLNFRKNEDDSESNRYQMIRQIDLGNDDYPYKYVLGQKSGNDLIIKAINGKTVTIKDYYGGDMYSYLQIDDYDGDTMYLYRGRNEHLFFADPKVIKLAANTNPVTYSNVQNTYVYGKDDIGYNVTLNNASYNNIEIFGGDTMTINIKNAQNNYVGVGYATLNYTFGGSNNSMYISSTYDDSVINITGNNNYIETDDITNSTFNLSGNGNYLSIDAGNNSRSVTMTVNTQGSNEVDLYADDISEYGAGGITWNVNSKGADTFNQVDYGNAYFTYNYNFTGSAGKNKFIDGGYYNSTNISGVADAGEIKISTDRTRGYVIIHNNGTNYISVQDYDMAAMDFHSNTCGAVYYSYGPTITIFGAEDNAADLNTVAFGNKIKLNKDGYKGEYKSLNNFAQYFSVGDSFTFGGETMGYMSNLTKDYIVKSAYSTNTTYSNFTFDTGRHSVYDAGGSADNLTIAEDINNIRMYFNIASDGSILNSDLYFLKSTEFQNFMKGGNVSGYLNIQDYIGAGQIENIQTGTYSLNSSYLTAGSEVDGSLIADVVSWMSGKGYADTDAVIATGTDADKTALFNIYNNHTDFANNNQNLYWGQG